MPTNPSQMRLPVCLPGEKLIEQAQRLRRAIKLIEDEVADRQAAHQIQAHQIIERLRDRGLV